MKRIGCLFLLFLALFSYAGLPAAGQSLADAWALHAKGDAADLAASLAMYRQIAADTSRSLEDVKAASYAIGTVLLSMKDYSGALTAFNEFEHTWPYDYRCGLSLVHSGNAMLENGAQYDQAETYFLKALQLQLSSVDTAQFMGWAFLGESKVLIHKGNLSDARISLEQAISWAPETCVSNEAKALLRQCPADTSDVLEQSSGLSPVMATAALAAARNYCVRGKYDMGYLLLQKAASKLTSANDLAENYVLTGECELALNRSPGSGGAFKAIAGMKDSSPEFLAKRADWLSLAAEQEIGRGGDEGVLMLKQFISEYPNHPSATGYRLAVGDMLLNLGHVNEAKEWFTQLVAANPTNDTTVLWKFRLAYCVYHESDWAAARDAFQAVYTGYPVSKWHDEIKYLIANCSTRLGDYAAAKKALRELTKDFPNSSWSSLGAKALASLPVQ